MNGGADSDHWEQDQHKLSRIKVKEIKKNCPIPHPLEHLQVYVIGA